MLIDRLMTDSTDQQPAALEALRGERTRIHPHHPLWTGDPRSFDNLYKLVGDIVVPCAWTAPPSVWVGNVSPRVCRFCNRDDTRATFKKLAHTVGASFGNRHHFTNEESKRAVASSKISLRFIFLLKSKSKLSSVRPTSRNSASLSRLPSSRS